MFRLLQALGAGILVVPAVPRDIYAEINTAGIGLGTLLVNLGVIGNSTLAERLLVATLNAAAPNTHVIIGMGLGSAAATSADQKLIDSVEGDTPPGYEQIQPGPTTLLLGLLRNPDRPNGGLLARFAPILSLLGIAAVTPPGTKTVGDTATLTTTVLDATWGVRRPV